MHCLTLRCPAPTCDIPRKVTLVPGSSVMFGRDTSKVHVWLDSKKVPNMISRVHAFCEWIPEKGVWQIRDNCSVNGVFVNDVKIDQQQLKLHDVITFGGGAKLGVGQTLCQPQSEFTYQFGLDNLKRSNSQNVPSANLSEKSPIKRKAKEMEEEHQKKEKKLREDREDLERERKSYAEKVAMLAEAEKKNREEQEKVSKEQEERRLKQLEIDREKSEKERQKLQADYEEKLQQLAKEQEEKK